MRRPASGGPRVGLKFCGGCNPAIDRAGLFQEVRELAGALTFTGLDGKDPDALLFICGCATACPVEKLGFYGHPRLVAVAGETVDGRPVREPALARAVVERLRGFCRNRRLRQPV